MRDYRINEEDGSDMITKFFKFLRLAIGGAVFAVAATGTIASVFGYDTSTQTDLVAAFVGGGVTSAVLAKLSIVL